MAPIVHGKRAEGYRIFAIFGEGLNKFRAHRSVSCQVHDNRERHKPAIMNLGSQEAERDAVVLSGLARTLASLAPRGAGNSVVELGSRGVVKRKRGFSPGKKESGSCRTKRYVLGKQPSARKNELFSRKKIKISILRFLSLIRPENRS